MLTDILVCEFDWYIVKGGSHKPPMRKKVTGCLNKMRVKFMLVLRQLPDHLLAQAAVDAES